ncbi:DUF1905 domain-containing protein [Sphingomonas sp. RB56-2]|uniref:DUF1905 domain-containing protein n=1 Tax=Sphingomonas brevis TaxID=2908206 RepID=A0ABT0S797_9SPHN|nr:DUF1905 domain-containing protein [Sphingomonas brevis]MCL6740269.1 DUF1905 domain-containing protein [Sphingomonas brevis]
MIAVTAPLQYWSNGEGGSHFLTIAEDASLEIRAHAFLNPRGFRSVKVECTIGEIVWRTSVFPQKSGGYFLPMKIDVCRRAGISAGDRVTVTLDLL